MRQTTTNRSQSPSMYVCTYVCTRTLAARRRHDGLRACGAHKICSRFSQRRKDKRERRCKGMAGDHVSLDMYRMKDSNICPSCSQIARHAGTQTRRGATYRGRNPGSVASPNGWRVWQTHQLVRPPCPPTMVSDDKFTLQPGIVVCQV